MRGYSVPADSEGLNQMGHPSDQVAQVGRIPMADKKSLERIGLAFGLVTAAVVLMGALVVKNQIDSGPVTERPVIAASIGGVLR
jgi:hypothetical protein